jgi:glycosyltransferase involved in cell wall biosynthesis
MVQRVLILIATDRVSGPLKGILQYLHWATRWKPILGLFQVGNGAPSDAMVAATSRGIPTPLLRQRWALDPHLLLQAVRIAREYDIDLVQSHGYKTHVLGWWLKRRLGIPWIGFAHGWTSETWRVRLYQRLDPWLMRSADAIVAVSEELKVDLCRRGVPEHLITTIHNAIEEDECAGGRNRGDFRSATGIPEDVPLVAVIGRLTREKGQRVFLRAFRALRAELSDARAVIVGEGIDEQPLRVLAEELGLSSAVRFVPFQPRVAPVYRSADVVVIPSVAFEGVPNVLLEAMMAGCPVVATTVGGIPEVVTDEGEALLVPTGDDVALAKAVARVLRDVGLREHLIKAARERVRSRHSAASRARRIYALYDAITR